MKGRSSGDEVSTPYLVHGTEYLVLGTRYLLSAVAFATILLLIFASPALAAPPKVNYLYPAGGQRGQTVAVTAAGDFSNWPLQVWADRPGIAATCEKDKGKLKLEIADDAVPGVYWLRLWDGEGASSLKPFLVGTLPEVEEAEPNDSPDKPQTIEPRVVINGKLGKAGDVDGFRVQLSEGQTLVAAVQAHSLLGSPMDAALQVCELVERVSSSQAGFPPQTEAYVAAQDHDSTGLDPQLVFTAPKSGPYLVRLFAFPSDPNSTIGFAGGDNYIYRLTLTTGAYLDHVQPLAVGDDASELRMQGWNVPEAAAALLSRHAADDPLTLPDLPLAWAWHPEAAGAFSLPHVVGTIRVPSDGTPGVPTTLDTLPATVSGRLAELGNAHAYAFAGNKGDKLRIRVEARAIGFPTDPLVIVQDEAGKTLAEADDAGRDQRDPELTFDVPADGQYRVVIRDLHRRGGPRMAYRATIEPAAPDFTLSLAADSFVLEAGKPLEIPVTVALRDGFTRAIEIRAVGLPDGIAAEPVAFQPGPGAAPPDSGGARRGGRGNRGQQPAGGPTAKLVLTGDLEKLQAGGTPIRIEGRAIDDSPLVRTARFSTGQPLAPPHHAAWLTVKK
jgi:hypothetical protein